MTSTTYKIQNNDTLSGIAARNKTTVAALAAANGITDPNKIIAGKTISIPGLTPPPAAAPVAPVPPAGGGSAAPGGATAGGTPTTGNPIAASGVRRYTGTNTNTGYDSQAKDYYDGLDTNAPDRNKIYNEQLSQMQAQIDAVNNVYAGLIADENVRGTARNGSTRAVNARSGILGDDFGNYNKNQTEEFNKEKIQQLNDKKSREIGAILAGVQARTDAAYEKAQELQFANKEKKLAYAKEVQTESRQNLADLAKTGVSLDQLTQDEYNQLIEQTGYDDLEFESIFNAAKSAREKVDYKYTNIGNGRVLRTGVDGSGRALDEKIFDYGVPPEYEIKETKDGSIYMFDKSTGQMTRKSGPTDPNNGDGAKVLSVAEAKSLGVPYGTTQAQAIAMGKIPGTATTTGLSDAGKKVITLVDDLLNNPATNRLSGSVDKIVGGVFGKAALAKNQYKQLTALLNLDNIKYLKGQGQITDSERKILEDASSAIGRNLSDSDFKTQLDQLRISLNGVQSAGTKSTTTIPSNDGDLPTAVANAGYDYNAMRADGLTDDQIRASIGI